MSIPDFQCNSGGIVYKPVYYLTPNGLLVITVSTMLLQSIGWVSITLGGANHQHATLTSSLLVRLYVGDRLELLVKQEKTGLKTSRYN